MSGDDTGVGGAVGKFFGWILMAIGGLIMVLSGLCSGLGLLYTLPGLLGGGGISIIYVLIFGGIPFGVGWVIYYLGKSLMPPEKAYLPRTPPPPEEGEL